MAFVIFALFFVSWFSCAWASGEKIAYVTNRDGNDEIYTMSVSGTEQTRLTNDSAKDIQLFSLPMVKRSDSLPIEAGLMASLS